MASQEAGVSWAKPVFSLGENLSARISALDESGLPAIRIVWTLYRNGFQVFNGEGAVFKFVTPVIGLYRLKGTAYFNLGGQSQFDSMAYVYGAVTGRHNLPVTEPAGTMVYLGAVFTQNIASAPGVAPSVPYKLANSTEDIYLLPGTTHWSFDLDPSGTPVDDEVVVRTRKGNWCLNGLGGGLTGEVIGYDYGYMPTYIPAPIDHRISFTTEMFKVNGSVYNGFNSRIRIKCYRNLAAGIYRYERCTNSSHAGGAGRRMRRWAALFTEIRLQSDVFNVLGTDTGVVPYTTVDTTTVPLMRLSTSGAPNPVPGYTGLFFTDSNLYAYYEADGYANIAAHAIAGIESVRPCCISFLEFNDGKPILSNRVKRVTGKLAIFMSDGVVFEGSTITVKVYRTDSLRSTDYTIPVTKTFYVNEEDTIQNIGEIAIDLSDYQFDETGIVVDISVTGAEPVDACRWELESADGFWLLEDGSGYWLLENCTDGLPSVLPTPQVGADAVYSTVYAHSMAFDGACYTNPVFQSVFDADAAVVLTPIGGCQDPLCGPVAIYCYTALDAPSESVILPQPFGRPAPYVAYGSNPGRCFYNPIPVTVVTGTEVATMEYSGSTAVDLWSYSGSSLCGAAFAYTDCQAAYAPCAAYACSIVVVYPVSSSPHTAISYGGRCYSYSGSTVDYGTRSVVAVADVDPVMDCLDPVCAQFNANGSVVVYSDTQTMLEVPVRFDSVGRGIPHYAAAIEVLDTGETTLLTAGSKRVTFRTKPDEYVYTATAAGHMVFQFGLGGIAKKLVVSNGSGQQVYDAGVGGTRATVLLQIGDIVYLRLADAYGRLPKMQQNRVVAVLWHPVIPLPRLYDTAVVGYSGTTSINALGFCAYTNEGVYSFYGSLPVSGSMAGPVNPDSWVTVTGQDGQEYNLISMRSIGDTQVYPVGQPWYGGQSLAGPFTFKFYAARQVAGFHGEMDVWFSTNGTFPTYLRAGHYDALELNGSYTYRKNSTPFDTLRNSYSVATQAQAEATVWPGAYASSDGQVISVGTAAGTIQVASKTYARLSTDIGLSQSILG